MKSGSIKQILIILSILLLPCVFYLLLLTGKNHFKRLEIYGPKDVSNKGDTIYHTIPAFSFLNQEGKTVSEKNVDGKIYVANFFFATCPDICPKMNANVKGLADYYRKDTVVKFLSFTVNPAHDTVAVLAAYAKERNTDAEQWSFLTGNKDSIYNLAYQGFMDKVGEKPPTFFHSENLFLIDKEKRIRGIYDGLEDTDVRKLKDEILVLEMEYKEK
jgi:protein SCO1/2